MIILKFREKKIFFVSPTTQKFQNPVKSCRNFCIIQNFEGLFFGQRSLFCSPHTPLNTLWFRDTINFRNFYKKKSLIFAIFSLTRQKFLQVGVAGGRRPKTFSQKFKLLCVYSICAKYHENPPSSCGDRWGRG